MLFHSVFIQFWEGFVENADLMELRGWLRGVDLNHRPLGYEPNELPDCSTPQSDHSNHAECRQTSIWRNTTGPIHEPSRAGHPPRAGET